MRDWSGVCPQNAYGSLCHIPSLRLCIRLDCRHHLHMQTERIFRRESSKRKLKLNFKLDSAFQGNEESISHDELILRSRDQKVCTNIKEEDMADCCFGKTVQDVKPKPLDPSDFF